MNIVEGDMLAEEVDVLRAITKTEYCDGARRSRGGYGTREV